MSDMRDMRDEWAAVIEQVARDGLPGPRDLDAALDALEAAIGIPAVTLRGLRDGSLVAVPAEPTQEMATAGVRAMRAPRLHVSHQASDDIMTVFVVFTAMLAAAQEAAR